MLLLCLVTCCCQTLTATNFYVNDANTKGDLYTTTIGNDANDGLSPSTPLLTLHIAYQKAKAGDLIYVDTGTYTDIGSNGLFLFENKKNIRFIIAGKTDEVLAKKPFPTDEKVSPSIFYIENDKPVERDVYLQHRSHDLKDK